jgi:hypothetical protein
MTTRRTLAALVVAACAAGAIVHGADTNLSALQQRVDRLQALTERVEALSAIKRLQYAYGHYAELGLWHDFADLFADSGIGHYTTGALNREQIRALFLKDVGGGQLGLKDGRIYPHISMQPVITLADDGQSARGRWHIMAMLGGYKTSASWAGGVYENQYVRENGVWKMKEVTYLPQYSGRYDDPGWTPMKEPTTPFRYDASRVGKPIVDVPEPARASTTPTLSALAARMADLAARAQRLSDEIDVANLQHAYGYYVDRKMWDDVSELFANDGTMEIGLQGVYVGRASIRRGLNVSSPLSTSTSERLSEGLAKGEINDRIHLQTIVTVMPDGHTARARGTELGMIGTTGGRALWTQSIYENEFVKQGGVWKFRTMHVYPRFIVDAEQGWAKDAQPAPGPSKEFPPDRPPTESYEIYPRFHITPLHFDHPVTGRPPQYPEGTKAAPRSQVTAAAASPVRTVDALAALLDATELSVNRSKAYHASENLVSAYGYYVDEFAWDETADLFSRDGWKELAYIGTYVGRERVRESMKRRYPNPKSPDFLTLHQTVQPVIHVSADGTNAKIRVRLFQLGSRTGGEGSFLTGIYENTAVNEAGTWKLSGMDLDYTWTAPSHGGWVRVTTPQNAPAAAMVREFPPDRPLRGPIVPPFPAVVAMPFHYKNPVSGRAPPLLLP